VLTAVEVAPTRMAVTGAASDYSGAGRDTSGHRCVPTASLNSSVLLAISPLCRAKPRAVDQDSAGTAPRCNWLVGDSGRARRVLSLSLLRRLQARRKCQANAYAGRRFRFDAALS
jgi:hypothetical protein